MSQFFSRVRAWLPPAAVGGATFLTLSLLGIGMFWEALPRVIFMFLSLALLACLGWWMWKMSKRAVIISKASQKRVDWKALLVALFAIGIFIVAFTFVVYWGSTAFAFLPTGNLLLGGWIGGLYLVLAIMGFGNFAVAKWKGRSRSSARTRSPRVRPERRQKADKHEVPQQESAHFVDMDSLFNPNNP